MDKLHHYHLTTAWTGNNGTGTSNYRAYERSHTISIENKADLFCSSDPAFRGDNTKHNPEGLLLASLSSCHMLWYLHLCAEAGVVVTDYTDNATGVMTEAPNGSGQFVEVTLNPIVTVTEASMIEKANELHHKANEFCFIANSVNFIVGHNPTCVVSTMAAQHFLKSYENGQRYFSNLDFEYEAGFSNKSFVDVIFENCFLYVDFSHSDLTNAQFIDCNLKEIDLSYANLTNCKMTKCLVESAWFAGAIVNNFQFLENYYYGSVLEQEDFNMLLLNQEKRNKE